MIKNVIFDLGNVVLSFHPYQYYKDDFHDEQKMKILCDTIFAGDIWNEYDRGSYTKAELKEAYFLKYPQWTEEIGSMLDKWVNILTPMQSSIQLMKQLKELHYHVYIMSNINDEAYQYLLASTNIFDLVDGMILSYVERINKPDAQIYTRLLNRYQLLAEECVFIDDRSDNIDTAKQLHMEGIVYHNHEQVINELKAIINEEHIC